MLNKYLSNLICKKTRYQLYEKLLTIIEKFQNMGLNLFVCQHKLSEFNTSPQFFDSCIVCSFDNYLCLSTSHSFRVHTQKSETVLPILFSVM
jgi:hypothetical protein